MAGDEIRREQDYVTMLYGRLDALRERAQRHLSAVLLDTGGTPQARSERDSYTTMYSDHITKYSAAEVGLCFGRIDMVDGERRYIGRIGIFNEDNSYESLLLDWRAPSARPFYLATPATPDGVGQRRHIRTRGRRVVALNDEYLDATAAAHAPKDGATAAGGVASEAVLIDALNAARTGHMRDIVATIQREQDAIVRSEHRSVLVVQGGPGTGKTAVALHRAAYLLYTYRDQLSKSGVLIVGPNETFLRYISEVLPSLGETGVVLSTVGDLYPGVTASGSDSAEAAVLKGSLTIVDVLKNAVRDRQELPSTPVVLQFDGFPLRIDRRIVNRARGRARSSRRPHNKARPLFLSAAIDALAEQFSLTIGENVIDGGSLLTRSDIADIREELSTNEEVLGALNAFWPELTPTGVLSELLSSKERLGSAAPHLTEGELAALFRPFTSPFSPADAPLLDELADLVGVDGTSDEERSRDRWRQKIAEAQDALDILTGSAPQDLEDELDPEILMAYDLIDAAQLAERQEHRHHLTTAERAASDRSWTYGHMIIDEAQELSEMAWRMLMRRIPNRWMTIVGDTAQTGAPAGSDSWQQVLEPYVAKRWKLAELTVNYRTPAEVMAVAEPVLAAIAPTVTVPQSIRSAGTAPWSVRVDAAHLVDEVRAHVDRLIELQVDGGTIAVLTAPALLSDLAASLSGSGTVSVLTVNQAKGLEFDSVLIVEPHLIASESSRGLNDLYVALTRATQRLGVIHSGALPDVLGGLSATAM